MLDFRKLKKAPANPAKGPVEDLVARHFMESQRTRVIPAQAGIHAVQQLHG
jgi:hypothetical protein